MSKPSMHLNHPDSDERPVKPQKDKAPSVAAWSRYTEEQRAEVMRIADIQVKLGLTTDVDFCRDSDVHGATWGQLKRGIYPGNIARMITRMTGYAARVQELHDQKTTDRGLLLHGRAGFVTTTPYEKLKTASNNITSAADVGSEDKCIWIVGDTGQGKDAMVNHLIAEGQPAWKMHAMPSWRTSYYAALIDISEKLQIAKAPRGKAAVEREIIKRLRDRKGLLVFTEVELMAKDTWDFFRSVLNKTPCGIIICITPRYFAHLRDFGDTGTKQLFRRSELVIEIQPLKGEDVIPFFVQRRWEDSADMRIAAEELAVEANKFGAMDFVQRVVQYLVKKTHGSKGGPSLDLVRKAIKDCRLFVPVAKTKAERRAA